MASVNPAPFGVGPNSFWGIKAAAKAAIMDRVNAVFGRSIEDTLRPPVEYVQLDAEASVSAGTTGDSFVWSPPYPITIVAVKGACLTAGGATGTVDVHVKPSGGSFATILSAPFDVKGTLATYADGTVVDTDSRHVVATTGQVKAVFASGSGGALANGRCQIYFVRTTES